MTTRRRALDRSVGSHTTITRRAVLKGIVAATVGAAGGVGAYGYFYERFHLGVTREEIAVRDLPPSLNGLRIGLLTDVHHSEWVSEDDVRAGVDALLAERPDLIILGGDYVTWGDRRFVQPSAELLAALHAPHGVFAILGNHDDDHDMPAALAARGIQVLKDARTRLTINGETIDLVGIRFWTRREPDIARLLKGAAGPLILLAHDPRRLTQAAAMNVPLVLSGHTHGGQIVLPGTGALLAAKRFPVASGFAHEGGTTLFVSRGLGTVWLPVRVNCPPEVAVLTLRSASIR